MHKQAAKDKILSKIQSELQEAEDFAKMYLEYAERYEKEGNKYAGMYREYYLEQIALATEWKLLLECYQ